MYLYCVEGPKVEAHRNESVTVGAPRRRRRTYFVSPLHFKEDTNDEKDTYRVKKKEV
jgi:hypothetical protein